MTEKNRRIGSSEDIARFVETVSAEAVAVCPDSLSIAFVGIRTRGVHLAQRIRDRACDLMGGADLPFGILDITLYRDDLDEVGPQPQVKVTRIPFDVKDKVLFLVDDVLFTGRTIRAALNLISDFGRPRTIKLAVMVDRGNRELPIQPDFTGLHVTTTRKQDVQVRLEELDGTDEVLLSDIA